MTNEKATKIDNQPCPMCLKNTLDLNLGIFLTHIDDGTIEADLSRWVFFN